MMGRKNERLDLEIFFFIDSEQTEILFNRINISCIFIFCLVIFVVRYLFYRYIYIQFLVFCLIFLSFFFFFNFRFTPSVLHSSN